MVQRGEHSPPTIVSQVRFPDLMPYVVEFVVAMYNVLMVIVGECRLLLLLFSYKFNY